MKKIALKKFEGYELSNMEKRTVLGASSACGEHGCAPHAIYACAVNE